MTVNIAETDQGARWSIWINTALGGRVGITDQLFGWRVYWNEEDVGGFSLDFGTKKNTLLVDDALIEFWRAPIGLSPILIFVGFYKHLELNYEDGIETFLYSGVGSNDLLNTRIVAYKATTAQAQKTDYLDDMMKDVVRENLGSSAGTGRNLTSYGLKIQADQSAVASDTVTFPYKNVLKALQAISALGAQKGTPVYFEIVPTITTTNSIGFEFRTHPARLGVDHTSTSRQPVYFGKDYGNLIQARYTVDRREEANHAYIGGPGEDQVRILEETYDAIRENTSVWNRREVFIDARNEASSAARTSKGKAVLDSLAPVRKFEAQVCNSTFYVFGKDWFWGDTVTCRVFDNAFDGRIRAGAIQVQEGSERIDARVEQI